MKVFKKRESYLLAGAILMVIVFLIDKNSNSAVENTKEVTIAEKVETANNNDRQLVQKYTQIDEILPVNWDKGWGDDPFFYTTKNQEKSVKTSRNLYVQSENSFDLTGISWLGHSGFAIINGSILKTGDKIGGHVVEKIAAKYVILTQGNKTVRLTINE